MSETIPVNPLFSKPLVYQLPYQGEIRRNIPYGDNGQHLDIYYPEQVSTPVPAVILVTGYSDPGFKAMTGMQLKDIAQNQSWARLLAASGIAVVMYTAANPTQDVLNLMDAVAMRSAELNLDAARLGILSVSGNVPNALHLLQCRKNIVCAALCYGFMLDSEQDRGISTAAEQFRFVNPNATTVELSASLALLLLRAGRDEFAGLNASIERFLADAVLNNRDIEFANYPEGEHAFDVLDDSSRSQQLLRRIVKFYQDRLLDA